MDFPYPPQVIPKNITSIYTIYGTKNCEYCTKIKKFFKKFFKTTKKIIIRYYDIDDLIEKKIIKNLLEFQEKMEPFIKNYKTFPIIFINDEFIGGYSDFIMIFEELKNKKKISPTIVNNLKKNNKDKELDILIQKILKKLI
jgi:glutaredoxin